MFRDHFPALRDPGIRTGFGDWHLRLGGTKMVADGAITAGTAYLSEPYISSTCDHGILAMTADDIEAGYLWRNRQRNGGPSDGVLRSLDQPQ